MEKLNLSEKEINELNEISSELRNKLNELITVHEINLDKNDMLSSELDNYKDVKKRYLRNTSYSITDDL